MITIRHKKLFLTRVLPILIALVIPAACSREAADADGFVNCNNGTKPTPIEQEFEFPGDLLFMRSDRSEILAFNGKTHELTSIYRLPSDGFYDISSLSQDGKVFVISHQDPSEMENLSITLLSNRGRVESKEVLLPTWEQNRDKTYLWFSVDWANNNYLQGVLSEKGDSGEELWESWLLNPYQLEWKSLSSINNSLDQAKYSGFSISPDLSRVLYVNKQYHLILYDLIQNKILWEYSDYDGVFPRFGSPNLSDASWSKDGEMLALPITRNKGRTPGILVLDRDGRIINSIYFGDYQLGFNWSKDGQFLAFFEGRSVTIDPRTGNVKPIVRMIDMKDGLLRDLCSLNEQTAPSQGISNNRIVWSPDQQFIAYSSWSINETVQEGIILHRLNDPQVRIFPIDNDTTVLLGWSEYHWIKTSP